MSQQALDIPVTNDVKVDFVPLLRPQKKRKIIKKKRLTSNICLSPVSSVAQHAGNCSICKHPDHDMIHQAICDGLFMAENVRQFSYDTIRRHMQAYQININKKQLAEMYNYYTLYRVSDDQVSPAIVLQANDQQQRLAGSYAAEKHETVSVCINKLLSHVTPEYKAKLEAEQGEIINIDKGS